MIKFTRYGEELEFSNIAVEAAYYAEKKSFQATYEWSDEQFDAFWNNESIYSYTVKKVDAIEFAQRVLDYIK
jgi:hypothetical protein